METASGFTLSNKTDWLIAASIAGLILLAPIIGSFVYIGNRIMFNFFAADSMYYMQLANNFVKFGMVTFDGETVSNGYHPLWEFVLIAMFKLFKIKHHNQIYAVFALSVFIVCAAYTVISYTLMQATGRWAGIIATLTLFPGVYSLCVEPQTNTFRSAPGLLYGLSPYSAINGMETPLSLLLWALFLLIILSRLCRLGETSGMVSNLRLLFPMTSRLCLAALVLARLDDGFIILAIGVFILLQKEIPWGEKIKSTLYIVWPACVAVLAYMVLNLCTAGVALPSSGVSKIGLLDVNSLKRFPIAFVPAGDWQFGFSVRVFPTLFALLFGLLSLCITRRHSHRNGGFLPGRWNDLWKIAGLFLTMKSLFLIIAVPLWHQGYWYYFSTVTICNLIVAFAIGMYVRSHKEMTGMILVCCISLILFHMPRFKGSITENSGTSCVDIAYGLWKNDAHIKSELISRVPDIKMVDSFDGMFAYLLDLPSESYIGLPSSPEELERRKAIGIWPSLISRGFTVVPEFGYIVLGDVKIVETISLPDSPVEFVKVALPKP